MAYTRQLYQDTLDLFSDTSQESLPFDYWKRDAYFFLRKYARWVRKYQVDRDLYVTSEDIEIVPHNTVVEGMEGARGLYTKPEGQFIRLEMSYPGNGCFKKAVKGDLNTQKCYSENYDAPCNCCTPCKDPCNHTFEFEDNLIALKWLPTQRGMMKYWYYREPNKPGDGLQDVLDFPNEFADLIALRCARRYMFNRHADQYGQSENNEQIEEITEMEQEFKDWLKESLGTDHENKLSVIPISKT